MKEVLSVDQDKKEKFSSFFFTERKSGSFFKKEFDDSRVGTETDVL